MASQRPPRHWRDFKNWSGCDCNTGVVLLYACAHKQISDYTKRTKEAKIQMHPAPLVQSPITMARSNCDRQLMSGSISKSRLLVAIKSLINLKCWPAAQAGA